MNVCIKKILNFLVAQKVIENNENQLKAYQYGLEICFSSLVNICVVVLVGAFSGSLMESFVFLIMFIKIRLTTGGFHASTYLRCNIITGLTFVFTLLLYKVTIQYLSTVMLVLAMIVISIFYLVTCIILSPIENPNKPIPDEKKIGYKIKSIIFGLISVVVSFTAIYFGIIIGCIITVTLFSIAILMIVGIIKNRRRDKYENDICEDA